MSLHDKHSRNESNAGTLDLANSLQPIAVTELWDELHLIRRLPHELQTVAAPRRRCIIALLIEAVAA